MLTKRKQPCCSCGHWVREYSQLPENVDIPLHSKHQKSGFICEKCSQMWITKKNCVNENMSPQTNIVKQEIESQQVENEGGYPSNYEEEKIKVMRVVNLLIKELEYWRKLYREQFWQIQFLKRSEYFLSQKIHDLQLEKLIRDGKEMIAKKPEPKPAKKIDEQKMKKEVSVSILSGLFYSQYSKLFGLLGEEVATEYFFGKVSDEINKYVNELTENHLQENRQSMDLNNLELRMDAGWSSRGYSANECSLLFEEINSGKAFDMIHITRREGFLDSSRVMERGGVRKFGQKWKNQINLKKFIHDNDHGTFDEIKLWWKDCKEGLDRNHYGKNIRKRFNKKTGKLRSLQKISSSLYNWFLHCVKGCEGKPELFVEQFSIARNHYTNKDHSKCNHDSNYKPKYSWITSKKATKELNREIDLICKDAPRFSGNWCTNTLESFFNQKTTFLPKRINAPKQYPQRVNMAILEREVENWQGLIMEKLGFPLTKRSVDFLEKQKKIKEYHKNRKKSEEYRKRRIELKEKKKKEAEERKRFKSGKKPKSQI